MKHTAHKSHLTGDRADMAGTNVPDEHRLFISDIPAFFDDSLGDPELRNFLQHYDSCSECRDEVSIHYLIHEGLARVESGTAFNCEREMNEYLDAERTRLLRRECFTRLTFGVEIFTVVLFAVSIAAYLFNFVV